MLADVVSVGSVGSLSGSRADYPNAVSLDITSAPRSSAVIPFSQSVLCVDVSCAVLRDGVKSAIRVGRSRKVLMPGAYGRLLLAVYVR